MWMRGLAAKSEAELWLKADIVPLIKVIKNVDWTAR